MVRVQDTLDRHKGVLHEVTESAVRFDLGGEILPVKRSKVYGFVYRHSAAAEPPRAVCEITDAAGSKWAARKVSLAGRVALDHLHGSERIGSRWRTSPRSISPAARSRT